MVYTGVFVWLTGIIGLMLGLKRPNLHWTVETQPIKQDLTVLFALLLGVVVLLPAPLLYALLLAPWMDVRLYLALFTALLAGGTLLLHRWLTHRGAQLFAQL